MQRIACQSCKGIGIITTMEPALIRGSNLRSPTRTAPMNRFCETCKGRGTVDLEPDPPVGSELTETREDATVHVPVERDADGYLTVGGYRVHAPAFHDAAQFDRAIQRAFDAGLKVEPTDRPGTYLVSNPTSASGYTTSRRACSCRAGQTGTPCKHIAIVCFLLDVSHELAEVA